MCALWTRACTRVHDAFYVFDSIMDIGQSGVSDIVGACSTCVVRKGPTRAAHIDSMRARVIFTSPLDDQKCTSNDIRVAQELHVR
jgi:hypothetical protein